MAAIDSGSPVSTMVGESAFGAGAAERQTDISSADQQTGRTMEGQYSQTNLRCKAALWNNQKQSHHSLPLVRVYHCHMSATEQIKIYTTSLSLLSTQSQLYK